MRFPRFLLIACILLCCGEPSRSSINQGTTVSGQDALEKQILHEEEILTNQLHAADQQAHAVASSGDSTATYMVVLAGLVIGAVLFRKALPVLATPFREHDPLCGQESTAPIPVKPDAPSHQEVFSEYLEKFNAQQKIASAKKAAQKPEEPPATNTPVPEPQLILPLETVVVGHVNALDQVSAVRTLFLELNRDSNQAAGQDRLKSLANAVGGLRKGLRISGAYPVGQMASALEALLTKLAAHQENLNASTMRTLAGAIDLLPALCSPGVRSDLASNPVISLLAVDDDAVSRHALTSALKRVWARPDLASDGPEGLRLAETRPYDLVFVDIEMPGMDGFELCSRIHSTPLNQATPVVFVTGHNDLPSRAKSSLAGGLEFLGKPFLTAELTVKALTLVLKRRLQSASQTNAKANPADNSRQNKQTADPQTPVKASLLQPAAATA